MANFRFLVKFRFLTLSVCFAIANFSYFFKISSKSANNFLSYFANTLINKNTQRGEGSVVFANFLSMALNE